jgi:hypothetical protein
LEDSLVVVFLFASKIKHVKERFLSDGFSGFPLPLVTDENKTSTGESKTSAIVTLAN